MKKDKVVFDEKSYRAMQETIKELSSFILELPLSDFLEHIEGGIKQRLLLSDGHHLLKESVPSLKVGRSLVQATLEHQTKLLSILKVAVEQDKQEQGKEKEDREELLN